MMGKELNKQEQLLSETIYFLRFPLTIAVLFIHFNLAQYPITVHGTVYGGNSPCWFNWVVTFVSDVVACSVVPMFFFISGYLFYKNGFSKYDYKKKLKTRFSTLFVPYILWNIIAVLFCAKIFLFPSLFPGASASHWNLTMQGLFYTFFDYFHQQGIISNPSQVAGTNDIFPVCGPLWYVRDLMIMVFISPLTNILLTVLKKKYVVVLGIFWFCIMRNVIYPHGGWLAQLTVALFFFSWGGYMGLYRLNPVSYFKKYTIVPYLYVILAVVDVFCKKAVYHNYLHNMVVLLGIVSFFMIASFLLEHKYVKVNKTLANSSFFVFALHTLIMGNLSSLCFIAIGCPENPYVLLLFYFFVPIFTAFVCLIVFFVIKKIMPFSNQLLTGGR